MIMRKGFSMKSKKAALYSQIKNYLIDIDSNLTHDFIVNKAKYLREKFEDDYSVSDAEFDSIIDDLLHDIPHSITFTSTSLYASYDERGWFYNVKNKAYAKRYFEYLQYDKNFSPDTINSIDKLTDNVMDQLGNPKSDKPFQQRGLILGEVQSGKTATYTAICNKAVDAGYKVIIVLTGLLESLRKQTQSRLDAELVGFLNNTVTNKESKKKKGKKTNDRGVGGPIGVGKRVKIESPTIMTYTSKKYDFNVQTANTITTSTGRSQGVGTYVAENKQPAQIKNHGVMIKEATAKGYAEAHEGDSINLAAPGSKTRRGRVGKGIANTLDTSCAQGVLDGYRIRKLTPHECFRLQGFPDKYFDRAAAVNSDSQLYKQAGNSVTVNVIYEIARRLT